LPVIPVNKVVDPKRIIGKKWRAEEEERHKGSLTKKKYSTLRTGLKSEISSLWTNVALHTLHFFRTSLGRALIGK
jgi:hypothetical protein